MLLTFLRQGVIFSLRRKNNMSKLIQAILIPWRGFWQANWLLKLVSLVLTLIAFVGTFILTYTLVVLGSNFSFMPGPVEIRFLSFVAFSFLVFWLALHLAFWLIINFFILLPTELAKMLGNRSHMHSEDSSSTPESK